MRAPPSSRRLGVRPAHQKKKRSPRWGRGLLPSKRDGCQSSRSGLRMSKTILELGRRAHCVSPGVGPLEVCRLVPVQMIDRILVFGVRLGRLASEDLHLRFGQAFARALTAVVGGATPLSSGTWFGRCSNGAKLPSPPSSRASSRGASSTKAVLIGEATRSNWFIGRQAENLFDRAGHVDLGVIRVVRLARAAPRTD